MGTLKMQGRRIRGGQGGLPPQILADTLTLFQSGPTILLIPPFRIFRPSYGPRMHAPG